MKISVKDFSEHKGVTVIHLQYLAYGSWDSLFPISMGPHYELMSPEHYFSCKSAIPLHPEIKTAPLRQSYE